MPIYEYQCHKCGEHFEVTQKMADPPLKKHGNGSGCGGKVSKMMSANTFHLKGGGWYKTDYASSGSSTATPSAKKDKPAEKETPAKTESTTTATAD